MRYSPLTQKSYSQILNQHVPLWLTIYLWDDDWINNLEKHLYKYIFTNNCER